METSPLKILAIDDNEDNLTSVKALIREAFPHALVLTATATGQGIELAQAEDPDVILLDVVMPGVDGFEACRQLKANPLTRYIPVVFLTAIKGDKEARIRALEVGAEAFLSKPIDEIELTAQIRAMQKIKAAGERERAEKDDLTKLVAAKTCEIDLAHTAALNLLEDLRKENGARQESEAHLRLLFENLPSGVVVHAADTAVLFANPEALRLLGLTLDQMLGKTATDPAWCFLRDDGGELALEDYPVNRLRTSGEPFAGQIVGIRLPGRAEPHWVQCSAYPQLDASGQISQVIVAFTDITERKRAEAKIEQESLLNKTIIESIPGTFYMLDEAGKYVRWSSYQRDKIVGLPDDQVAGFPAINTLHPDDRALIQARIANVLRTGADETVEGRVLLRGGPKFQWLLMTGRKLVVAGHPYLVGIGIDITDRKRAEEKLRRYEMAVEQSSDGIAIADLEGTLTFVNTAWARMHGYETTELIGQPLSICHNSDQMTNDVGGFTDAVRRKGTCLGEVGHRRKDGATFPTWMTGTIMTDHQGKAVGMVSIVRDITEQKLAERERLRLSTAMEQANDVVVVTDREGVIQYVNPAFEKVTGYSRQEALGQNPRFLKSGEQDAVFYRRMWASLAAGETWSGHMINKRKDGSRYEEDATLSPVRDATGKIVNYVAVKRDVTHEVHLEAQLRQAQKMEAVGRLAGGVAHDFNNLLMGIMNYTQLCRDKIAPDHPIREYLNEITHDAERSAEITRQLLAFARKQTIAPRVVDLNTAVEGILNMLRRLIGEDIHLAWLPGQNVGAVRIDPSQVDQLLANLCVNARDAIAGVGEITLQTGSITVDAEHGAEHPETLPGPYVFLAVSDNGCGMDKETLAQVFEPFFTTKGLGKGTGLGLATVYGIVKQNNGFIHTASEPGKGTTFKIHLPQTAAESVATTVTSKSEVPRGRGETILLVEDEKSLRVTCSAFLVALGYQVTVAETPGDALKFAERHPGDIHVLLTDVVMPGMDGRQLGRRIGALKPDVKVLFMSGYTADVIAQRGVLDDGVRFLAKPFTRDALARKVRQVLEEGPSNPSPPR